MKDYRIYYLDEDGRIVRREVVRCAGDPEALVRLEAAWSGLPVELWDLGRLVKRIAGAAS